MTAGESDGSALEHAVAVHRTAWIELTQKQEVPVLEPGAIHAVVLDLATVCEAEMQRVLDDSDRLRSERIREPRKRRLYLGGRFGLKRLLSWYTGIPTDQLRFGYGDRGKPALLNSVERGVIEFNYTLSGDKVLYAFARDIPLGVDMEVLPRKMNAAYMAKTRLTRDEREAWLALPEATRNDAMLCCWTRKEAYGKALGVGIRFRLGEVSLFRRLDNPCWHTARTGLFETTNSTGMPDLLQGVQLSMPFAAVASIMAGRADRRGGFPALTTLQLRP